MSTRDEAWKAYQEWKSVSTEHIQIVRDDLAHAFDVLTRLEPSGGIATSYVRKKLYDAEENLQLRKKRD